MMACLWCRLWASRSEVVEVVPGAERREFRGRIGNGVSVERRTRTVKVYFREGFDPATDFLLLEEQFSDGLTEGPHRWRLLAGTAPYWLRQGWERGDLPQPPEDWPGVLVADSRGSRDCETGEWRSY